MKRKLLLTIAMCFVIALSFAQGTYYWVGGTSTSWSSANNWSLSVGGTGGARSTVNSADILIFDGSNIGSGATGAVTLQPTGNEILSKLVLQNGAILNLARTSSGTTYLYIDGEVVVSANSMLNINGNLGVMCLVFNSTSNSTIQGQLNILGTAANRLSIKAASALRFGSGSSCNAGSGVNAFSTLTTSTNPSVDKSVIFQSGSSFIYKSQYNPFGSSTSNIAVFQSGSNFTMETANVSNIFTNRNFGNVIIRNNIAISLSENFLGVENLTIENGSSFLLNGTGPSPIFGNIVNNGTLGVTATGSSNLILIGNTPQLISGSGSFNLGAFSVATDANVTLGSSINLAGTLISYIYGAANVQNNQIKTNGVAASTGRVQFRSSVNTSTSAAVVTSGSNVITFNSAADFASISSAPGLLVSGPNIESNTYIINTSTTGGTNGFGSITLSKAALSSGTSINLIGDNPTLTTSNSNGVDGSFDINSFGSLTLSAGTNFIFNGASTSPFSTASNNALGDVTFNTSATTNKSVTINGKLTLNGAKLTVSEGDMVTLASTGSFGGSFSNSSYILTAANTSTGAVGKVRFTDLSASTLIPVGTAGYYAPVTLAPTTASTFDINVFSGATSNATPNGAALTAAQKLRMVDAVWNISRSGGSGSADVTLAWPSALEGADFAGFGNAQIGIASYSAGAYGTFTGSGNAAANTATFTTSAFSPLIVGEANTTLPLTLLSFTAKESLNSVKLAWRTTSEVNLKNYVLQHRGLNGFEDIYSIAANNRPGTFNYNYTHLNPVAGVNYYRLIGVDNDGTQHISDPKSVVVSLSDAVSIYPNPVISRNINVAGVVNGDVIKILNVQGQVLVTKKVGGNQTQEIDVQHIQAGTYILSIENAEKITTTKKIIKI